MSFIQYKTHIEEGDIVVAYLNRESAFTLNVKSGDVYNNKYGVFRHDDMIGLEYGRKLASHTGRGFIYLLHPTPELWTAILPHRTQILYLPDIAYISGQLDLRPGSIVIESGTGSGSFTHSIARSIAPSGHLYTFEFHAARAQQAASEITSHGLADVVTLQCRNVCKDGFDLENTAHAVFLDLPAPWEAIASAKKAFVQNRIGRICCFSPCIEQVQRTCDTLRKEGFTEVRMVEALSRSHDLKPLSTPGVEAEAEATRQAMINRKRFPHQGKSASHTAETISTEATPSTPGPRRLQPGDEGAPPLDILSTKPPVEIRGHTSYLTFATFVPSL